MSGVADEIDVFRVILGINFHSHGRDLESGTESTLSSRRELWSIRSLRIDMLIMTLVNQVNDHRYAYFGIPHMLKKRIGSV